MIPKLGAAAAADLASAMLQDVWDTAGKLDVNRVLAAAEFGSFPIAVNPDQIWTQSQGDLGSRIEEILRRGLEGSDMAFAVGSDSPLIAKEHLECATRALAIADAVIGRAGDGGFYLLGLKSCPPGLLADLPWSTSRTAEAVENRLRERGMHVVSVSVLDDVDVPEDLSRLREQLRANPEAAPATQAWFKKRCPTSIDTIDSEP